MQGDPVIMLAWMAFGALLVCNLIAAGCAALFHIWSGDSTPGVRMLAGAAMGGFLPAVLLGGLVMIGAETVATFEAWTVMAVIFLIGLLASFPGAVLVTKKLHRPPDYSRHFE